MKFYKVSWEELNQDCLELYQKIKHIKFDKILCISRGGLVWARMFSDLLNLPVSHITAVSYTGVHERKDVKITELPNHENLKNQVLLVIDEIGDHGKTLAATIEFLKSIKINKFYSLSPIIRTYTDPKPDFFLKVRDEWIIFPYELKETYDAFLKIFKTPEKARQMLLENGFKKEEINTIS
jgi:hypoxanthine phosphoribosyltransferase